jgi:glycosyltransferase involved in cell wall biosynthesis
LRQAATRNENRLRGLWLARELPFPQDAGDKIYSGNLAKALAETGTDLTLVGIRPAGDPPVPGDWPIKWNVVPGKARSTLRSLISTMPLVAASYATPDYRRRIAELTKEEWDFVVIDQYGLGWALPLIKSQIQSEKLPVLVHVAHDHEATLLESLYRNFKGSYAKRLVLWQNYLKAKQFERDIASHVDLVTAITEEDAKKFASDAPDSGIVVLKPGYSGTVSSREKISTDTPRRVVLVGSFHWIAKQENLRRFVEIADPVFAAKGIELQIIGSIPDVFAAELSRNASATFITGFVESIEPYLEAARIAVVPEAIGGGFKLKFLDYIFGRMPVATLTNAAAGLPEDILDAMVCSESLECLARDIADVIDNLLELNAMQETALSRAETLFRWSDRGNNLLLAIQDCLRMRRM